MWRQYRLAALDFLWRFPEAHVVAVEPDAGNFAMLGRNLQSDAGRVTLVHAGVWSAAGHAVRDEVPWRDGREWSIRLRPTEQADSSTIELVSITTLLERQHWARVDPVKIDIEGAEREVFQSDSGEWLSRTRVLAVELHDSDCERAFESAIRPFPFQVSRIGELTVATRQTANS